MKRYALPVLLMAICSVCSAGEWIQDEKSGCKVSNPYPKLGESITWSGQCKDGIADGPGLLQWYEDGKPTESFEGAFRAGKREGQGTVKTQNGFQYIGGFRADERHGYGKATWADGMRYEGQYVDGKRNGFGTLTTPKSAFVEKDRSNKGFWRDDTYIEQGLFKDNAFIISCETSIECEIRSRRGVITSNQTQFVPQDYKRLGRLKAGGKWALVNEDGVLVSAPIWDDIQPSINRYLTVTLNGKKGLIDREGKVVVPPKYKNASAGDKFWYLTDNTGTMEVRNAATGKVLIPGGQWRDIDITDRKDTFIVTNGHGDDRQQYLLSNGKRIGPFWYIDAECINDDAPAFKVSRKDGEGYQYIRFDGKELNGKTYRSLATCFSQRYRIASALTNGEVVLIDAKGQESTYSEKSLPFSVAKIFDSVGAVPLSGSFPQKILKPDGSSIPVNLGGRYPEFKAWSYASEPGNDWVLWRDEFTASTPSKPHLIVTNLKGELVAGVDDLKRLELGDIAGSGFTCGFAFAQKSGYPLWGVVNTKLEWVVAPAYTKPSNFTEHSYRGCTAKVSLPNSENLLIIDTKGNVGQDGYLSEWGRNWDTSDFLVNEVKFKGRTVALVSKVCGMDVIKNARGATLWQPSNLDSHCEWLRRVEEEDRERERERQRRNQDNSGGYVTCWRSEIDSCYSVSGRRSYGKGTEFTLSCQKGMFQGEQSIYWDPSERQPYCARGKCSMPRIGHTDPHAAAADACGFYYNGD